MGLLEGRTHFEICPSRSKTVFICDRRSGSCIVGVYVEAALGTLTGVVGSDAIVLVFVGGEGLRVGMRKPELMQSRVRGLLLLKTTER